MVTQTETRQATSRQRYALWCITKKDYRNKGLTYEEASRLIKELGDPNYVKKSKRKLTPEQEIKKMVKFMKDNHESVLNTILEVIGHKSILVDDLDPERKPKYVFYGFGCGFTWFEGDKRNKNFKRIYASDDRIARTAISEFRNWIKGKIDIKVRNQMKKNGSPIEAVIFQDMNIQSAIYHLAADYGRKVYGIDNIWVNSRLD